MLYNYDATIQFYTCLLRKQVYCKLQRNNVVFKKKVVKTNRVTRIQLIIFNKYSRIWLNLIIFAL